MQFCLKNVWNRVLDYENVRLKYGANLKDRENGRFGNLQTFEGSDLPLQKPLRPEIITDDFHRTAA